MAQHVDGSIEDRKIPGYRMWQAFGATVDFVKNAAVGHDQHPRAGVLLDHVVHETEHASRKFAKAFAAGQCAVRVSRLQHLPGPGLINGRLGMGQTLQYAKMAFA